MENTNRTILTLGARGLIAGAVLGIWATTAEATILVFDQMRQSGVVVPIVSGGAVPQDYGDRVAGAVQNVPGGLFTYGEAGEGFTPRILVDYFVGSAAGPDGVSLWRDLYGDLIDVAFGNQNSNTLNVRLTADPGFSVLLYDFDLAGWPNTDFTITAVRLLDGSTTLFSQTDVLVQGNFTGPRHTSFAFANPVSGGELLIQIDYSNLAGNQQDNIGIDNIRFGQFPAAAVMPEPSTALLLGVGLLCAVVRVLGRRCSDSARASPALTGHPLHAAEPAA